MRQADFSFIAAQGIVFSRCLFLLTCDMDTRFRVVSPGHPTFMCQSSLENILCAYMHFHIFHFIFHNKNRRAEYKLNWNCAMNGLSRQTSMGKDFCIVIWFMKKALTFVFQPHIYVYIFFQLRDLWRRGQCWLFVCWNM